jgi:WD40 repeat protein
MARLIRCYPGNGALAALPVAFGLSLLSSGLLSSGLLSSGLLSSGLLSSGLVGSGLLSSGLVGSGLIGSGLGMAAYGASTDELAPPSREPQASASGEKPAPQAKQPRLDLYGDPLPEGAIARLGTVRLDHGGPVGCLLYSHDGKTVISGGSTKTVRWWDVVSGKEVRRFVVPQRKMPDGKEIVVCSLALSSDGNILAVGASDGTIYLWDIASGKLLRMCQGDKGGMAAYSVAFSRNDRVLASCGGFAERSSQVRLWEVSTGKELRRLPVGVQCLYSVAFSPISDTLAVSGDATILVLDSGTGKVLHKLQKHINVIIGVAFSRDGTTLASIEAGRDERDSEFFVRLWDVESGQQIQRLGHQNWVQAVAFGADGMLAASSNDICFWDSKSGKRLRHSSEPFFDVRCLAFSPDGKTLACGNGEGVISFCDVGAATRARHTPRHQAGLQSVAISPDGRTLATASADCSVGLWDVASAKQVRRLTGHKGGVRFVAFSPSGMLLASASVDNVYPSRDMHGVILCDGATGAEMRRIKGCCVAFSPDGKQIACGGFDDESDPRYWPGIIRLYEVETGKLIRSFRGHKSGVRNIAFSPDGKTLASVSMGNLFLSDVPMEGPTLRLWDVASGRERYQLDGPSFLAFSPDGKLLVTANEGSNQVHVWEVATGKKRRVAELKNLLSVSSLLFMPDGRTLVVGGSRGEVDVFDLATGSELGCIRGHAGAVNGLALSPDAKRLFSGSADTTALVWDLPSVFTPPRFGLVPLAGGGIKTLWACLASADAIKADQAIWALSDSPQASVSFLKENLHPAVGADAEHTDKLIAELDSDRFAAREKASKELEDLGELARQIISKALADKPTLEVRQRLEPLLAKIERQELSAIALRQVRAMEVLEHIATPEARDLLKNLAAGAPEARSTQDAKAALARLTKRIAATP